MVWFKTKDMKKLVNYFLQGLLYIAPVAITAYIIYLIFSSVDGILANALGRIFGFTVPGLGLLIIIIFLIFIGFIGQSIFALPFKKLANKLFDRIPILKIIYSAFNDLFSAFVGKQRKFNRPVMVLINKSTGIEKLGFLTEDDLSKLGISEKVAVYFPHSYNFSGELCIVPVQHVKTLDTNPVQTMKFIVSAGISGFDKTED